MTAIFIVAIVFGGIVLSVGIIAGTILMGMRIRHGGMSKRGRKDQAEDARLFQELYQGLLDMEKRVESLETILMENRREDHR